MIPAGQFDRLIQFERQVRVRDDRVNAYTVTWVPHGDPTWAKVLESSQEGGNPAAAEDAAGYARPTKVWIRWRSDIDKTTMRINHGGRLLEITGSAELGRREQLEFSCKEWAHKNG